MDLIQKSLAQLLTAWRSASRKRQAIVVIFATVTVLAVGTFAYLSSNGEYQQVYSNLSQEDFDRVTSKLNGMRVPFRVESNNSVLVPVERMAGIRSMFSLEGIPTISETGSEKSEGSALFMTPYQQSKSYTKALQSELARMIMQIESVAAAQVIINRVEPTPFIRDQRPSTASVVLKIKNGATLSRSTAASIVGLVARAVDGLRSEYVSLVDSTGRRLSDARPGDPEGEIAGQLDQRRDLENHLARKAEDLLAKVLGPGRAFVKVSAEISTQRIKERRESYSADERVVAREKTETVKSTSPSPARGSAGTGTNIVRTGGSGSNSSGSGTGTSQTEINETSYENPKTVREIEDRNGAIQRLTVSAAVDLSASGDADGSRPPITKEAIEGLIKQAIGFRANRDEITVTPTSLPGDLPLKDVEDDAAQIQKVALYVNITRNAALGVGFLTALGTMWLLLRRRPVAVPASAINVDAQKRELDRFLELAERDPERLANLLESLIGEPATA